MRQSRWSGDVTTETEGGGVERRCVRRRGGQRGLILLCCCGHGEEEEGARAHAGSGKKQSSSGEGLGAAFGTDGDLDAGERWRSSFGGHGAWRAPGQGVAAPAKRVT